MKTFGYIMAAVALIGFCSLISSLLKSDETMTILKLETSNLKLDKQCDSLQNVVNRLRDESRAHNRVVDSLQMIIDDNSMKIDKNQKQYENEMVRINAMPNDSLLLFFTEYLEGSRGSSGNGGSR